MGNCDFAAFGFDHEHTIASAEPGAPQWQRTALVISALVLTHCLSLGWSLVTGLASFNEAQQSTVLELRGIRLLLTALTGANLAVAGVVMQGLFRNPLADPGLLAPALGP